MDDQKLDASELVALVSESLFEEKRKEKISLIRVLFLKAEQLQKDIKELDVSKTKKEKSLSDVLEKIEKVKKGDWSVLGQPQEKKEEIN
jgi:hypothetical protein